MHAGGDKRSRLQVLASYIKSGKVVFAHKGYEQIIQRLVYFGIESHDDLVDTFSLVANQFIIYSNRPMLSITWIEIPRPRRGLLEEEEEEEDEDGWRPFP